MDMETFLDRISGPLSLPRIDPRAMDDPVDGLVDLAERVNGKSVHVMAHVRGALVFVGLCTVLSLVLLITTVLRLEPAGAVIFLLLTMGGFHAFRILLFNYRFFDFFSRRYHAILYLQDDNPVVYSPRGDTPTDRLLNHLRTTHEPFGSLIERYPESIRYSAILRGSSGGTYQFDAYIGIGGQSGILKSSNLLPALGKRGYALFIKVFERSPTLRDVILLEESIQDITALTCLPPRVIILRENGQDPPDHDLHRHITENGAVARCRKGSYPYNVQVVTGHQGGYHMVPMISSEGMP